MAASVCVPYQAAACVDVSAQLKSLSRGALCSSYVISRLRQNRWMEICDEVTIHRSANIDPRKPQRAPFFLLAFVKQGSDGVFHVNKGCTQVNCSFCKKNFKINWTEDGFKVMTEDSDPESNKLEVGHNVPYSEFNKLDRQITELENRLKKRVNNKSNLRRKLRKLGRTFDRMTAQFGPYGYSSSNCTLMCGKCNREQQDMRNDEFARLKGVTTPTLRPCRYPLRLHGNDQLMVTPENEHFVVEEILKLLMRS